ncbi:MAG: hypothetical protein ACYSU4_06475 [Planctomycetota bacterium]|jgi:hypothetical protein
MNELSVVDIDTEMDFKFLEFLGKKGVWIYPAPNAWTFGIPKHRHDAKVWSVLVRDSVS